MPRDMAGFGWVTAHDRADASSPVTAWVTADMGLFATPITTALVAAAKAAKETRQKMALATCPTYSQNLTRFLEGEMARQAITRHIL